MPGIARTVEFVSPLMIRKTSFRHFVGYLVATAMVVSGLLILTGYLLQIHIPTEQMRIIFGSVLILYGIFRFLTTYYAEKRLQGSRSILEDESWKDSGPKSV